ncbi:hypothetical protein ANN_24891 [Periplaneta americana]|uniref:Uncharacterized protein n=1 Tax=Periplaneta americana TaxID=6978 RepID=A0ABQ8RZV2_PERAM|nr:hypothetical protein ANN_24891 [Periplaneta americana]
MKSDGKKWAGLVDKSEILPDHPPKETVATIRIATGHDCLAEYLYKLGILPSPQCVVCNEENSNMEWEHLNVYKKKLLNFKSSMGTLYRSARNQMMLNQSG